MVVGEGTLEQVCHDLDVVEPEEGLILGRGYGELHGIGLAAGKAGDLVEGTGGNNEVDVLGQRFEELAFVHREPEAVRGGEGEVVSGDLDLDAGEHRPRVLGGGGDGDVFDRVVQHAGGDLSGDPGLDGGHGREIACGRGR